MLPLPDQGKITIVGARPQVAQAAALLGEIDPGSLNASTATAGGPDTAPARPEWRAASFPLKHITGAQAEQTLTRLLTPRQSALVKFTAAGDARSIILSGPDSEVSAIQSLDRKSVV